jgi:hypothetical protein
MELAKNANGKLAIAQVGGNRKTPEEKAKAEAEAKAKRDAEIKAEAEKIAAAKNTGSFSDPLTELEKGDGVAFYQCIMRALDLKNNLRDTLISALDAHGLTLAEKKITATVPEVKAPEIKAPMKRSRKSAKRSRKSAKHAQA